MSPGATRRTRWLPSLRALVHAHVGATIFVVSLAASTWLHLTLLPVARHLAAAHANRILGPILSGRLVLDHIGGLGLAGVGRIDAHVDDEHGARLLTVRGLDVRLSTSALLRSLWQTGQPIAIGLPTVTIEDVDLALDPDESGVPKIAHALSPRSRSGSSPPDATPGPGLRLSLPDIRIAHARVHVPGDGGPHQAYLSDLRGSLAFSSSGLVVDVSAATVDVEGLPHAGRAQGSLTGHLAKPPEGPLVVRASWNGTTAAIHETADVALSGDHLDATVEVAPTGSAEVCALLPEWPIAAICAAHAEAHGALGALPVSAHVDVGGGTLDASGTIATGAKFLANAHFDLKGFDGRSLVSPVPLTGVSASGDATLERHPSGEMSGRADLALLDATLNGARLPPGTVAADFATDADGALRGHADVTIREPGAPAVVSLVLDPGRATPTVTFQAAARVPRLEAVPRLGRAVSGSSDVVATGTIVLGAKTVDATVTATGSGLSAQGVSVAHARLTAHAIGTMTAPNVHVEIDGEGAEAYAAEISAFHAQSELAFEGAPTLRDLAVDLAGDAGPVHAHVASARLRSGDVAIDDARVDGLGETITGSARSSPEGIAIHAQGKRIDLARVGSFGTIAVRDGDLALDVDAVAGPHETHGHVVLDLSHGVVGAMRDVEAHVEASAQGRRISGKASLRADDLGTVDVASSTLEIGKGPLLSPAPWRQAWGRVDLDGRGNLAKIAARLPPGALPFGELRGALQVHASVGRDSLLDITPYVELTAKTEGLVVQGARAPGAWRLDGVDPSVHVSVNGDTGATALKAQVADATGTLVSVTASSTDVPYAALFFDQNLRDAFLGMPFAAELNVPSRRLDSLPALLGTRIYRGSLTAGATWKGSVTQPLIDFTASFDRGKAEPRLYSVPVDVELRGHYDGARLNLSIQGAQRGKRVADAALQIDAAAREWLAGARPWTASGHARLDHFPLRSFETLDDRQVRGEASGEVSIDRLNDDARARASLRFDALQIGDVACTDGTVHASLDGKTVDADVNLVQADGGTIAARAHWGARWGAKLAPEIDFASTAMASLRAKRFRAAVLLPFLSGTLTELDGRVDADAELQVDAVQGSVKPRGAVVYREGVFELSSVGSEFRDASATITFSPSGIAHLQNATARGTTGIVKGAATAWIRGLAFGGASASLEVPTSDPLPLVIDGVELGKIGGRMDMTMNRAPKELDVDVNVPVAQLELPSGSDSRDIQDLHDLDGVRVGTQGPSREFVETPLDAIDADADASRSRRANPTPVKIDLKLGHDVRILRGNTLDVRLVGQPTVTLAQDLRMSGQIRLAQGSIDVQGKPFELEPGGTVNFVGDDPTNPQVVLSAHWTAPDSTQIFATFTGPLKTGKVTLRSEPAKSPNEILALILFGTSDQPTATAATTQTQSIAATAGGAATQPLNQALGGVNRALDKMGLAGGISAKVDTSTPNPRPEVEIQIARDISLQIAWVVGNPPPSNPDTALLTVDWRFLRKWSLEATQGDAGTSILDVVWQHRY